MRAYRYDACDYPVGYRMSSRGDHISTLHEKNVRAEEVLRACSSQAEEMRRTSLYVWLDKEFARYAQGASGCQYLYEVEVAEEDVRHIGDLDYYTMIRDSRDAGVHANAAAKYWEGVHLTGKRRLEALVSTATVVRRIV